MKMKPSKTEALVWADAVRIAGPFTYTGDKGARRYFKLVQCIARGILHGAKETTCSPASSASPAAAPGTSPTSPQPSAGSVGGGHEARGGTGSGGCCAGSDATTGGTSTHTVSVPKARSVSIGADGAPDAVPSAADPTAVIRADPRRPKWLTDEAIKTLPTGTQTVECVRDYGLLLKAFPSNKVWATYDPTWDDASVGHWSNAEVYHVPQPAPADKPDPLDQLAAEAQAEGEDGTACRRWREFWLTNLSKSWDEAFNTFVAAECERAVRDYKAKTPTPRRTAREVAEEVARRQGTDLVYYKIVNSKWGPVDEDRTQTAIQEAMLKVAQAAIERDREGR